MKLVIRMISDREYFLENKDCKNVEDKFGTFKRLKIQGGRHSSQN